MKKKAILVFTAALMLLGGKSFAQMDDCAITVSLFTAPAQSKNYDEALKHYDKVIKDCPANNVAVYQLAERMFEYFIDKGDVSKINDLEKALELRIKHFPSETEKVKIKKYTEIAQLKFDKKIGTAKEQYDTFDKINKMDKKGITSPKAIYTYFNLAINRQEAGEMGLQDIFNLYDVLIAKVEDGENKMAKVMQPLMEKQDNGESLDKKTAEKLDRAERNLENYGKVKGSLNGLLGQKADCTNLIPLYEKDYEAKKNDVSWLKNVAYRLDSKECEAPLINRIAEQLHSLEPSAASAYALGRKYDREGNSREALDYYNQAVYLEKDPSKKVRIYYRLAEGKRKAGSFGTARTFYNKMLELKPSSGIAYLKIAQMIASSSSSCGGTPFEKRAVNWKAAEYADRAARVDASIAGNARSAAASYRARAPQKGDIFNAGMAGKTIPLNCWVGGSVRVPNL